MASGSHVGVMADFLEVPWEVSGKSRNAATGGNTDPPGKVSVVKLVSQGETKAVFRPTQAQGGKSCVHFNFCFSLLLEPPNRFIKYHKNFYVLFIIKL